MSSIKFITLGERIDGNMLTPAPSVRDWEYIKEELDKDTHPRVMTVEELLAKPFKVLESYRGGILYLEGGISVIYNSSKNYNGHSVYEKGPASVRFFWPGGEGFQYYADVELL
jgi:hypothetical protein